MLPSPCTSTFTVNIHLSLSLLFTSGDANNYLSSKGELISGYQEDNLAERLHPSTYIVCSFPNPDMTTFKNSFHSTTPLHLRDSLQLSDLPRPLKPIGRFRLHLLPTVNLAIHFLCKRTHLQAVLDCFRSEVFLISISTSFQLCGTSLPPDTSRAVTYKFDDPDLATCNPRHPHIWYTIRTIHIKQDASTIGRFRAAC